VNSTLLTGNLLPTNWSYPSAEDPSSEKTGVGRYGARGVGAAHFAL
jgi:hypothetical protein